MFTHWIFSCAYVCTWNSVPDSDIDLSTTCSLIQLNSGSKSMQVMKYLTLTLKTGLYKVDGKKSKNVSLKYLLKFLEYLIANRPEICIQHIKEITYLSNLIMEIEGQYILTNWLFCFSATLHFVTLQKKHLCFSICSSISSLGCSDAS